MMNRLLFSIVVHKESDSIQRDYREYNVGIQCVVSKLYREWEFPGAGSAPIAKTFRTARPRLHKLIFKSLYRFDRAGYVHEKLRYVTKFIWDVSIGKAGKGSWCGPSIVLTDIVLVITGRSECRCRRQVLTTRKKSNSVFVPARTLITVVSRTALTEPKSKRKSSRFSESTSNTILWKGRRDA